MKHDYIITGMTCTGCQQKVQNLLRQVPGVKNVAVDLSSGIATIEMTEHLPVTVLESALAAYPKYQLKEALTSNVDHQDDPEAKTGWQTYRPIVLIFAYIAGITLIIEATAPSAMWMRWMENFMAGFFLTFSFFKLLDLRGFADSYSTYDIIARRWRGWGYVYAFTELGLGIAYLTSFNPAVTNAVTFIVMFISIIGVLQSVLNKRKIKCACLGAVFNLPMSTVTIIEDGLMIVMSAIMFINII